jgi:hypothetical protein
MRFARLASSGGCLFHPQPHRPFDQRVERCDFPGQAWTPADAAQVLMERAVALNL